MNKIKIIIAILLLPGFSFVNAQQIIHKGKTDYLSNTLVIKVKQDIVSSAVELSKSLSKFSIKSASEIFPSTNILRKGESVLSGIYLAEYVNNEDPVDLAKKVSRLPGIVWAEPKYIRSITYTPNDSIYNISNTLKSQPSLKQVYADSAWNYTKGDKSIIIGIIDTGVDWEHPDLEANILKDALGKKVGYDFGGTVGIPDEDPSEDIIPGGKYHGTHVAGIASAVTDNHIGVASIGFNCSILPVKVSRSDKRDNGVPYVWYGFEGVKWAADNGAKIISCSWGGYSYSSYEQSIIDYAISKGAVVIAAQGNDGYTDYATDPFYPADYEGVLSVGWLNTGVNENTINGSANYGEGVKVFAPGTDIISTWQEHTEESIFYKTVSGSSMSTPLVSGLAGLVWYKFPNYKPLQVEEQIRVTSDNIEGANGSQYAFLLGRGKINALRAVTDTNTISVRADSVSFVEIGNNDGIFEPTEKVGIEIKFTNYLSFIDNVKVTLTTDDKYVTIESASFNTESMSTLETVSNNTNNRFVFKINSDVPYNHDVHFMLQFNGTNYNDFQWIKVRVNPTYRTHDNNNIVMTVTSTGTLAFNDYPNNSEGRGFRYKGGENLMFEGAFMYGTSSNRVMDAARLLYEQEHDFVYNTPISITSSASQQTGFGIFSDSGNTKLGIQTVLSTYSYSQAPDNNYVILRSKLNNNTANEIDNLYAGYFIDWDIPESGYNGDTTYFDDQNKIAIAYNKKDSSAPYTGVALISQTTGYGYYGIDNNATSDSIVMNDDGGFTDTDKWYALHNGVSKRSAGVGDISLVVSGGPFTIPSGKSVDVAFAFTAGETLGEVISAIQESKIKYETLSDVENPSNEKPASFALYQNYPNPFNPSTTIQYSIPVKTSQQAVFTKLKVYDLLGCEVATLLNEQKTAGNYEVKFNGVGLPSGVYFYRLTAGDFSSTRKMLLLK